MRGSKSKSTTKQKRQAKHIEEGAKKRGYSTKRAGRVAYATVNKEDSGGKKSGTGRGKTRKLSASRSGGKRGGRKGSRPKR